MFVLVLHDAECFEFVIFVHCCVILGHGKVHRWNFSVIAREYAL